MLKHELKGLVAEVDASNNTALIGIRGTVVEESKGILELETENGKKKIPKNGTRFIFTLPDGKRVAVDGKMLAGRPEKRMKTKRKKW